jgi:DNA-binding IclR family transcriptional regulator
MIPRSRKGAATLKAIRELTVDGVPPSLTELAHALGLRNRSTVHGYLVDLRNRGLVTWDPHRERTLRILEDLPVPAEMRQLLEDAELALEEAVNFLGAPNCGSTRARARGVADRIRDLRRRLAQP